jgi:acetyl esterase/lipase
MCFRHPLLPLLLAVLGLPAVSGFLPLRAAAPPPLVKARAITETLDIPYGKESDLQRLDVFAPTDAHGTPVVFFVHGGTWMFGDKNFFGRYRALGRFLARQGYTAVLINYRLSPLVKHPEHVKDTARAFAWTYKNIDRYGGDRERIVVVGHSSGAHLVTLMVLDPTYLADPALKLPARVRRSMCGVVSVCGIYRVPGAEEFNSMLTQIVHYWTGGNVWGVPVLMRVGEAANPFRMVFGEDEKVRESASPISHVRKGLPPFLVLYAGMEVPGLAGQAADFAASLRKAGNKVELKEVEEAVHAGILFKVHKPGDRIGRLLLDFVEHATAPMRTSDSR